MRPHPTRPWIERTRILRSRVEAAGGKHSSVAVGLRLFERDASIGGGLLAGALAYRLFVLLLPTTLLFVSGLGLYAGAADKSPRTVAREAGLHGLIAAQVASTAASGTRWLVFIFMVQAVVYATASLYRAVVIVHAIAWEGSGRRRTKITPKGLAVFGGMIVVVLAAAGILGWIRRHDQLGGLTALVVYLVLVGGAWLVVSMQLPHRDVRWPSLLPGALLVGLGLLLVNVFNVYVTTRLVEGRANTYGALGIATALLFSLVLVGRVIVFAAELNASFDDHRARHRAEPPA